LQSTIECVCGGEKKLKETEFPSEIEINRTKKPQFEDYVEQRVRKEPEGPSRDDVFRGGAQKLKISSKTTERYLNELCSTEGPYEKVRTEKGWVIRRK